MSESIREVNTSWLYNLVNTKSDRSTSRSVVERPFASQLVGVDASRKSGLKPHQGFKRIHDLSFYTDPVHNATSVIKDCFNVEFDIGSIGYGFGFVYRAVRPDGETADVFLDFWNSRVDDASTFGTLGHKVVDGVSPTAKMSVVAWGQFVYIFIEGRHPAAFYVKETETVISSSSSGPGVGADCSIEGDGILEYEIISFGLNCNDSVPGPGKQPILDDPRQSNPLGTLQLPSDHDETRPAVGQIALTKADPGNSESSSSSSEQLVAEQVALVAGEYTFAYMLIDSVSGRRSAISEIAQCRESDFGDDEMFAALEIIYDSSKFDQVYVFRSVRVQVPGGTPMAAYMHLDGLITLSEHHTERNGEGLDFDPALTDYRHAVYFYEKEDKPLAIQPNYQGSLYMDEQMPKGGAAIWYEGAMIVSSIRGKGTSTDERNLPGDTLRGLGEFRYSGLDEISPEMFPPINRYVPRVPNNTVVLWKELGTNVIGFSNDRMYETRKENVFIAFEPIHEGYGIVGNKAADTVGSMAYFVTPMGIGAINSKGTLDDVRAIDQIIQTEWAGELADVSVAYDPKVQVLFVHNPTSLHTALFWLRTQQVTELFDTPFVEVRRGVWPKDLDNLATALEARAFFIQNPPPGTEAEDNIKPRVFVVDAEREKVITGSSTPEFEDERRITLLDVSRDTRFTTADAVTTELVDTEAGPTWGTGIEGAFVYVADSSNADFIGVKAQIRQKISDESIELTPDGAAALSGLPAGSRLFLSPVYMRWTGYGIGVQSDNGADFSSPADFFAVKKLDSIACSFTDVSGPPLDDDTNDNRWRGLAYRGAEEEPAEAVYPRSFNDQTPGELASVGDGTSAIPAAFGVDDLVRGRYGITHGIMVPGVEIFVPDLDFHLLSVRATGKITASTRVGRPEVT